MAVDRELLAIQRVMKTLDTLTQEEKIRVINYVESRLHSVQMQIIAANINTEQSTKED